VTVTMTVTVTVTVTVQDIQINAQSLSRLGESLGSPCFNGRGLE
jgi:hypothetical protein